MIKYFRIFITSFVLVILPTVTRAAEIIPNGCRIGRGNIDNCGLEEFIRLFVNIYDIGIQYVGAVAVLFFIIGGFVLLISAGRSNLVDMGKKIIIGSVIGMIFVLASFLVVEMIQTRVLDTNNAYLITDDNECIGRPDGASCRRMVNVNGNVRPQGVFVCISGMCAPTTQCDYESQLPDAATATYTINGIVTTVKRTCWDVSFCDGDSIVPNQCPGGEDRKCCFVSEERLTPAPVNHINPIPINP